jgi:heme-degrading monooxygenase HmoA
MFVHIWRMKGRKKRAENYEKFGRQVTLPALKKLDGCVDAHFIKVFEARKPEYLWLVYWRDKEALEAARTNPTWREQIKKFEAGKFYKTIPLELVCETLASFESPGAEKPEKPRKVEKSEKAEKSDGSGRAFAATTVEGE